MLTAELLSAAFHGRAWKKKIGKQGMAGMLLIGRAIIELHAWVEAHRK